MKNAKRRQNPPAESPKPGRIISRKEERKNAKKLKKIQREAYFRHEKVEKVIAEKFVPLKKKKKKRKNKSEEIRRIEDEEDNEIETEPNAKRHRKNSSDSDSEGEDISYEQYLKEVDDKKREIQMDTDLADEDDQAISRYGKLLGMNKRKSNTKTIPKSFVDCGLDALLEFCDADNREALVSGEKIEAAEEDDDEVDASEEESVSGEEDEDDLAGEVNLSEGEESNVDDEDETDFELDEEETDNEQQEGKKEGDDAEPETEVEVREDIYGRQINKKTGELIQFDLAAARRKLEELDEKTGGDSEAKLKIDRLVTGIINRLSDATLVKSKQSFGEIWQSNSKNDVKSTIAKVMWKMMSAPYRLQDSILSTYAMFLALLHSAVNSEISAHYVEVFFVDFVALIQESRQLDDKSMENKAVLLSLLLVFKVFRTEVMMELLKKIEEHLNLDNLNIFYVLCKYIWKPMKKHGFQSFVDQMSSAIIKAQNSPFGAHPRAKFLIDEIEILKKGPPANIDFTAIEHQQKTLQSILKREKSVEKELGMGLSDLLQAEERGRWWVVGSSFRLPTDEAAVVGVGSSSAAPSQNLSFPQELMNWAVKAKMNTQIRKNIFCSIAAADGEDDAFERLLRLSLKGQQEREIIYVIIHMMLKEKQFNSYYPILTARFCEFDRRFILTTQYALWDRIRDSGSLKPKGRSHLAQYIGHLISHEVLSITILKVVEWGTLSSAVSTILRKVFATLAECSLTKLKRIFKPVLNPEKNALLTEGLSLFLQVNFADNPVYQKVDEWFTNGC